MTNLPLLEGELIRRSGLIVVQRAAVLSVLPLPIDLNGRLRRAGLSRHGRRDHADLVWRLRRVGVLTIHCVVHRREGYLCHQPGSGGILGDQSDRHC